LRNTYGIGIFLGQDDSNPTDGTVRLDNIKIRSNYIEAGKVASFNIPVLIRPGTEAGYTAEVEVADNIISILDAQKAGKQPRVLSFNSNTAGNTLLFTGNKLSGLGSAFTQNVAITQSGNTYLDGSSWSL
jgi:hypothetical protein